MKDVTISRWLAQELVEAKKTGLSKVVKSYGINGFGVVDWIKLQDGTKFICTDEKFVPVTPPEGFVLSQEGAHNWIENYPEVVESYDFNELSDEREIKAIYFKDGTFCPVERIETEEKYLNRKDREQQEAFIDFIENEPLYQVFIKEVKTELLPDTPELREEIELAERDIECSRNCGDYKKRCDGPDDPCGCLYHLMAD